MVVSSHGAGKQGEIHIPIPWSIYVYTLRFVSLPSAILSLSHLFSYSLINVYI